MDLFPEILEEIFQYFCFDKVSLHSCVLVNRGWCKVAVPILWKQPFLLLENNISDKLIEVYASFITDEAYATLLSQNISWPLKPFLKINQTKTFIYPSFLRHFKYESLYLCLDLWYRNHLLNIQDDKIDKTKKTLFPYVHGSWVQKDYLNYTWLAPLYIEIFKVFLNCGARFECLDLYSEQIYQPVDIRVLFKLPGIKNCLSNLKELSPATMERFTSIDYYSKLCRNVKSLKIESLRAGESTTISELIKAQVALEHIYIGTCTSHYFIQNTYGYSGSNKELLIALLTQASSLKSLEIKNLFINEIPSFNSKQITWDNLESLTIYYDNHYNLMKMPFGTKHFPKLQKLYIRQNTFPTDLIEFIQNTNISLKEIHLILRFQSGDISNVIQCISNFCTNLVHFESTVDFNAIPALFSLLQSCKNLIHLSILNPFTPYTEDDYRMLSAFLPSNLRNLILITNYKDITDESFGIFLQHLHVKLDYLDLSQSKRMSCQVLDVLLESAKMNKYRFPKKIFISTNPVDYSDKTEKLCKLEALGIQLIKNDDLLANCFVCD
ncbi:24500_t:CDS:1 [Gigaspora margarita]|uniref:24500_t:CDS:1 n=1 Tax=Gigaspora margarita TaxID=4874 RepID=A0ABM8W0H2_GIGMA|nr:24500_t:CDS:1 [Gigaspora margarita]